MPHLRPDCLMPSQALHQGFVRLLLLLLMSYAGSQAVYAQPCTVLLRGSVTDAHDGQVLEGASIYLESFGKGTYSDATGRFSIELPCGLQDTLSIAHLGCETVRQPLTLTTVDAEITATLEHHTELLDAIEVHAHRNRGAASDIGASMTGEQLDLKAGDDLTALISALPGVEALRTGANVARPLVDGLGGSRLQIVQNGTALAAQDWGDEHAPEIDPFAAVAIQLARGGAGLRFGASGTGATLVVDDAGFPTSRRTEGQVLAVAGSNQKEAGLGASLGQALSSHWGYRAQLYANSAADAQAPTYVLSNTAARRASGAARIFYKDSSLNFSLGYRGFAQETGILRAAHIGNLSDLQRALASDEPLIIEPQARTINAPRQQAMHHWLSAEAEYTLISGSRLRLDYSLQLNQRQEFDLRRANRSDRPSVDLELTTHNARAVLATAPGRAWQGSAGLQAVTATNRNVPGTGVRPFIPHYDASTLGAFMERTLLLGEVESVELGARLDHRYTQAHYFSKAVESSQLTVLRRREWLGAASVGYVRYLKASGSVRARLAYGSRSPNPAERFAEGVHHALAVIERGDTSLQVEHGLKASVGYSASLGDRFEWQVNAFAQGFRDFIYAQQLAEPELTIRGAFPVLIYRQTDALLSGLDLDAHLHLGPWQVNAGAAILRGQQRNGEPLPDISPWRLRAEAAYSHALRGRLKDWRVSANGAYVARQTRVPSTLLAAAPPEYALLGLDAGTHLAFGKSTLGLHLTIDNLLNQRYRDYLDRLRFYADRPGQDIQLRLLLDF